MALSPSRRDLGSVILQVADQHRSVLLAYASVIVMFALASAMTPGFASASNIAQQLIIATFVGIVGIGQTFLILTGNIDLSVSWCINFAAVLMASLFAQGHHWVTAVAAALLCGGLVGLVNGIGVAYMRIPALIMTLAMNAILHGVTLVYTNAQPPKSNIPEVVRYLAVGRIGGFPVAVLLWLILAAAVIFLLHRTPLGRWVYAVGNNEVAAYLSGVPTARVLVTLFVISGFCAALTGVLLTGYSSQSFLGMGEPYLLPPIAAVVIGGTNILGGSGGYIGTIAGTLSVVLLESVLSIARVPQAGKLVLFGAIILGMLFIYGRGKHVREG